MENNQKILQELESINKNLSSILIYLLAREGYSDLQIRKVFGKIGNDRIYQVKSGFKNKKNNYVKK